MIEQLKASATKMPVRSAVSSARYTSRSIGRTLFGLYCLDAALDFHSADSNTFQICVGIFSLVAFIAFALNARRTTRSLPLLHRLAWLWWIYLATTPLVAYFRGYDFTHYLRIALPQFLMGTSLMMGYILLNESSANAALIYKGLFYSTMCSTIIYLVRGLATGNNLEDLRYTIGSPLLIIMISFALYRLLFEGIRSGLLNLVALGGGLTIVFLTVTRTYFVSIAAVLVGVCLTLVRPPCWVNLRLRRRIIWNIVVLSAALGVIGTAMVIVFPTVISHWSARSSTLGTQDATTLARIAEAAGEIEEMRSDTSHLLFGSGIGSDHKYDSRYVIGVTELREEASEATYSPGHIGWVYQFYTGGLLLGWVPLLIFAVAIWKGNSRRTSYIARMAGIAVTAVFVTSTLGNMFGDRSGGTGMGLLIALSLYSERSSEGSPKLRRTVRQPFHPQPLSRSDFGREIAGS